MDQHEKTERSKGRLWTTEHHIWLKVDVTTPPHVALVIPFTPPHLTFPGVNLAISQVLVTAGPLLAKTKVNMLRPSQRVPRYPICFTVLGVARSEIRQLQIPLMRYQGTLGVLLNA